MALRLHSLRTDYALLFFQPSEQSIKMLFHSEENLTDVSLIWFSVIYFFLACWTYGISVPSGLFVPSLLIGAAVGRLYGECVAGWGWSDSQPGVYSLVGAAAVLGGMSRMTISLTVILIEATNDYTYGLPLMLTLITARWVGNVFNDGLYDIHVSTCRTPLLGYASGLSLASLTGRLLLFTGASKLCTDP